MKRQRSARFVLTIAMAAGAVIVGVLYSQWRAGDEPPWSVAPATSDAPSALAALRAGNIRFVTSHRTLSVDTAHDSELRRRTAKEQHPFVAVLCCSDSRVCPEFIFDQHAGRIFEIRNAGNVVDEDVLASFEYAVEHFHSPLLLVLAHKGCGAIQAVFEAGEKPLHAHLHELQDHMKDIHQQMMNDHDHGTTELLDRLSKENARHQARSLLRDSEILRSAVVQGDARLLCGVYDMETGSVEFFDPQ